MKKSTILFLFSLAVFAVGCVTVPVGISPSNRPLISENGTPYSYEKIGERTGSSSTFSLFGMIPFGKPDIDEATKTAMAGGDALINVRIWRTSVYVIIGTLESVEVQGDAVRFNNPKE